MIQQRHTTTSNQIRANDKDNLIRIENASLTDDWEFRRQYNAAHARTDARPLEYVESEGLGEPGVPRKWQETYRKGYKGGD